MALRLVHKSPADFLAASVDWTADSENRVLVGVGSPSSVGSERGTLDGSVWSVREGLDACM